MNRSTMTPAPPKGVSDPAAQNIYRHGLRAMRDSSVPFLVGGAYAFASYTGIARDTKDFDIFVHPRDRDRIMGVLTGAGYQVDLIYPHWLAKAFHGDHFIDIVFSSGNGLCLVDDEWFDHAVEGEILGLIAAICPVEEMIWSKSFIMERERYDGADIVHVLRACGKSLAWPRLLRRFDAHWRLLLSHLILFGFIYPGERDCIPDAVMQVLLYRLEKEMRSEPDSELVCNGTLLSREQYLVDVMEWGYRDARLLPTGTLTQGDVAHWTAAIDGKNKPAV